ncbi:MAG: hypothetical protein HY370_09105 [Proteobacteria bacterium]|nr:hypothetical protein [Pseudomonadota bacterium]
MTINQQAVDAKIEEFFTDIRKKVETKQEQEDAMRPLLKGAPSWRRVPDGINDETIVAFVTMFKRSEFFSSAISPDLLQDFNGRFLRQIRENDAERYNRIVMMIDEAGMYDELVPGVLSIYAFALKDMGDEGEWALVALLWELDEDMNPGLPQDLQVSLYMSLLVTPHSESALTKKFNVPAVSLSVKEGGRAEALIIPYKPECDGLKIGHLSLEITKGDMVLENKNVTIPFMVGGKENAAAEAAPDRQDGPA